MSLTPATVDPNRKEELARKKKDPNAFGQFENSGAVKRPPDWKPSALTGKAELSTATADTAAGGSNKK